ncbi:sensor histidine kinase [Haliovirga abyssi]|uniref:histidine kinase n=1 Tax=Haliovirga abyssi TaxID=2996794 RepID=A0AAU9DWB6_9FUSO|nr:ATP-binding protein [Haliovirga abyssi]BDU50566.1 hypothetical protein HLVA_11350 [Haliovirga abyssi]
MDTIISSINRKILIIDDQVDVLNSLKRILGKEEKDEIEDILGDFFENDKKKSVEIEEKYEVSIADRGEEGFELVKKSQNENLPYAVVFIDMRMPGWDGLKTAKKIREIDKDIEIVIMTAYSDKSRADILKTLESHDKLLYLKKPFDIEEIKQMALSLTLKWSLSKELVEKYEVISNSKKGLEKVINSIDKIERIKPPALKTILDGILKQILSILELKSGMIIFYDNGENYFENKIETDLEKFSDIDIEVLKIKAEKEKNIFISGEFLVIPLKNRGKLIAMGIIYKDNKLDFNEEHFKLFEIFISHAINLLKNSELYTKLEKINKELKDKNEELKKAYELNKKFLVISSHELRTPITLINGYAEMLEIELDSNSTKNTVSKLKKSVERLTRIVNSMLEVFAVSNEGKEIIIEKSEVTIEELFESLKILVEEFLEKRSQKLILIKDGEIPSAITDKKKLLYFALVNIMMNAIKFSPDGAKIEFIAKFNKNTQKIEVSIKDYGVGIEQTYVNEIFKPFFTIVNEQFHHSGVYEYKASGIGMGLTIAKNIIELMGEKIWCTSKLESGTEIIFTLSAKK